MLNAPTVVMPTSPCNHDFRCPSRSDFEVRVIFRPDRIVNCPQNVGVGISVGKHIDDFKATETPFASPRHALTDCRIILFIIRLTRVEHDNEQRALPSFPFTLEAVAVLSSRVNDGTSADGTGTG